MRFRSHLGKKRGVTFLLHQFLDSSTPFQPFYITRERFDHLSGARRTTNAKAI